MAGATNGKKPDAFLSYARLDDQVSEGYISWLRDKLEGQINAEIGKGSFSIFQDTDEIRAGEHWASALDEALAGARFLIPILSPSYFASQPCLFELAKFHGYESASGRKDLIIPVYFRDAPDHWENPDNPHAALLRERQVFDWRQLRHRDRKDPEVLERVERLARDIKTALLRTAALARATATPVTVITAPEALATLRQELAELRAELDRAHAEAADARQQLQATEKARSEAETRARDTHAQVVAAQATIGAERGVLEREIAATKTSLSEVRAEAEQLRARLEAAERAGGRPGAEGAAKLEKSGAAVWLVSPVAAFLAVGGISAAVTYSVVVVAGRAQIDQLRTQKTFQDTLMNGAACASCPEMVVIPAGSFTMGSPPDELGRNADEGPQRQVTFARPFLLGRYEVTFAEWDACVAAGGCNGYRPADAGWGRGRQPVINVSWEDAQAFALWLAGKTGQPYRLPTEPEWEYAARARTTTPFWTGATISAAQANYDGDYIYGSGIGGRDRERTAAVDSPAFPTNPFGLYHVHGNVWEWVRDCYRDSYREGAAYGSMAVETANCPKRVLRGGSWFNDPGFLRSGVRFEVTPETRNDRIGFRVARALTP